LVSNQGTEGIGAAALGDDDASQSCSSCAELYMTGDTRGVHVELGIVSGVNPSIPARFHLGMRDAVIMINENF